MGFENVSKVGARGLEGCFPFAKFQMQDARFLAPGDGALFQAPCKARESRALARRSQGDKLQGREASERANAFVISRPAAHAKIRLGALSYSVSQKELRVVACSPEMHVHAYYLPNLKAPFQTKSMTAEWRI